MSRTIKIEIKVNTTEQSDILIAELSELKFYAFEENKNSLSAFVKEVDFNENELIKIISPKNISFTKEVIKNINWNAKWESEFEPIIIKEFVAVRASFHKPIKNVQHEIIITPKMSFGTGHHATTYLMLQQMQSIDFCDQTVLDFGTGTGILAIMSKQLGAKKVIAIDNDEWSISNARENFVANNCPGIILRQKDKICDNYNTEKFDIILANINLNVITRCIKQFQLASYQSSQLLLSGFLESDRNSLVKLFTLNGFKQVAAMAQNNWLAMLITKS